MRPAVADDAAEIVHLGALMYASVGARPTPEWAVESTELVRERLGKDLFGYVIDAPEGGLACCGLVNVAPRLPRPGASSHQMAYVQWVSTAPQHQRKGYAHAVMESLMAEAKRLDLEVVELHASPQGRSMYEGLGFFVKTDNVAMSHVRGAYAPQRP